MSKNIINELMIIKDVLDEKLSGQKKERYRDTIEYSKRCFDFEKLREKYENFIPVIIDYIDPKIRLTKRKYLVHNQSRISQLLCHIRSQITLGKEQAIFLFADNVMLSSGDDTAVAYYTYLSKVKDKDKFFYLSIYCENTFGKK
jgi:hypothetical protein